MRVITLLLKPVESMKAEWMREQDHPALKVAVPKDAANSLSCSFLLVIYVFDEFLCDSGLLKPQDGVLFVLSQGVGVERPVAIALEAKEGLQLQVSRDRNTRPALPLKRFTLTS